MKFSSLKSLEQAENLALAALHYIAGEEDRLMTFLAQAGLDPDGLRDAAKSKIFLNFVMDFICSEDAFVLDLAREQNIKPEVVMIARHVLAGAHEAEAYDG